MTSGILSRTYTKPFSMPRRLEFLGIGAGAAALLLLATGIWADWTRVLGNSLVLFIFILTLGLGSLFLVTLEYTVNATWSVPFRRISENLAALVPASLILALPMLLGVERLYEWMHPSPGDAVLAGKSGYLNLPFFMIRFALFFTAWIVGYRILVIGSRRQDQSAGSGFSLTASRFSPVFMILLVITITFAAFDWIMSLVPHWYSSIFGIYLLVSCMVAGVALTTFVAVLLKLKRYLPAEIDSDHFYNLGALLFALNTAWAYIAFAQFLLIWYANLPGETIWYAARARNGWGIVSWLLILAHFLVPFVALLNRSAKTDLKRLRWVSLWVLGAHGLDMYWLITPSIRTSGSPFSWQELWLPFAAAAVLLATWRWAATRAALIPVSDPKLESSLHFHL
ncbi:MAG: quinol:cytochrome C oxidoreductase [Acidobacteria bacterium]|nr:MAG: quinol:cytochrome C oxidoreductase [Acidobacteriota bacterium]